MADDNVQKIYQFLTWAGNWKDKADCMCKDGVITKEEFSYFVKNEWKNWDGQSKEDENDLSSIINAFWKTADTKKGGRLGTTGYYNTHALDNNELQTIDNKVGAFGAIEDHLNGLREKVNSDPKFKTYFDVDAWIKEVRNELTSKLNALLEKGDVSSVEKQLREISPEVQRNATANLYTKNVLEKVKDQIGDFDYKNSDLANAIQNYVKQSDVTDIDAMVAQIQQIIDKYLGTAGVNVDSNVDTSKGMSADELNKYLPDQKDSDLLNDLQKVIVETKIRENLKDLKSEEDYKKYNQLFDSAINKFIQNVVDNLKVADFDKSVTLGVEDFKASDDYKNLAKSIAVQNYLAGEELYNILKDNYGEELANRVQKGDKYIQIIKSIKQDVLDKVANGDFDDHNGNIDLNKVKESFIEQIESHIVEIFSNNSKNMSLTVLELLYDAKIKQAETKSDDERISEYRKAAIEYCEAVSKKSSVLANAIKDILGGIYSSVLSEMLPYEIEGVMTEIKSKVAELGDANDLKGKLPDSAWGELPESISVSLNETKTIQLGTSFSINGNLITTDRITYSTSGGSILSVNSDGVVTVQGGNSVSVLQGTVNILVDGVIVGTKSVTINVMQKNADIVSRVTDKGWGNLKSGLAVQGCMGDCAFTDAYFTDLYNSDVIIKLDRKEGGGHWDKRRGTVVNKLTELCNCIKTALLTTGLDSSILSEATKNVIDTYVKKADAYVESTSNHKRSSMISNTINYMNDKREESGHRIQQGCDKDGSNDDVVYLIRFKDLVDDILDEYKRLGGSIIL